jgi:FkbM family methyltransferase
VSLPRTLAAMLGYDLRKAHKSDTMDMHLRRFFSHHEIGLVVDCGAFVGGFAIQCRKSGYSGPILSFEPSSKQYATLAAAASEDAQWHACKIGLGDVAGERDIYVSSGKGNLNSLYNSRPDMHARFGALHCAGVERVVIDRLDSVLEARGLSSDVPIFIKSDTQGNDLNVLRGAGTRLRQTAGILLEMSVQPLYDGTPPHWEVLEFARASGFEPYGFSTISRDKSGNLIEYDAIFRRARPTG